MSSANAKRHISGKMAAVSTAWTLVISVKAMSLSAVSRRPGSSCSALLIAALLYATLSGLDGRRLLQTLHPISRAGVWKSTKGGSVQNVKQATMLSGVFASHALNALSSG